MSAMFLPGPSELTTELPLLDSALVQELKETSQPRPVCLCGTHRDLQPEVGKGGGMLQKEKCSDVGLPALWPVSGPLLPQPGTAGVQQAAARCCCGSKDRH